MRHTLAAVPLLVGATPLIGQEDSEHRQALRNSSFVQVAEPVLRRRLEGGLALLRGGKAKAALERLLPVLTPAGEAQQVPWGERETRDFYELLEDHLEAAPARVREAFAAGMEKDARTALARAGNEPAVLRAILRAYPATAAAAEARRKLVDGALERGDAVAAGRHLARLPERERAAREPVVRHLERTMLGGSTWPTQTGGLDGLPLSGAPAAPEKSVPAAIAPWPRRGSFQTAVAGGAVGAADGRPVAVFQDPASLLVVADTGPRLALDRVDLARLTGKRPGLAARPVQPCMIGDTLYLVHGGPTAGMLRPGSELPEGGQELLALRKKRGGFELQWRRGARAAGPSLSARATLHPFVVAAGDRAWILLSEPEDRLNRRVYAACFDRTGERLWVRFVAKGAPLTAGLLEHRQETIRQGDLRPAPAILAAGRLVVETGLGVVACLDAADGTILWTFRTARVKALKTTDKPWESPRLVAHDSIVHATPSDSLFSYRLRVYPGMRDVLAELPAHKRSLTRLLGLVPDQGATYWFRRGLREAGPLRFLLEPDAKRPVRYDAPPLQPGEKLAVAPLLTTTSLVIATRQSLYWLDLGKDLFYERAFDLARLGRAGWGPALPFAGGVLFAGDLAPLLWK